MARRSPSVPRGQVSPGPAHPAVKWAEAAARALRATPAKVSAYVRGNGPATSPYQAASPSEKLPHVAYLGPSDTWQYQRRLIGLARHLYRNDAWLRRGIGVLASAVIGLGPHWCPRFPEMGEIVNAWLPEADARGSLPFGLLLQAGYVAETVDGDLLWRLRPRDASDGLTLPVQLQALEADHLPWQDNRGDLGNGRKVVQGIEFDALERRTAYNLFRTHPADRAPQSTEDLPLETVSVPAAMVMHQFRAPRIAAPRGETRLVASIVRALNLNAYEGAEQTRKLVSTLFAGFIKKDGQDLAEPGSKLGAKATSDQFASVMRQVMLEPGILAELPPGTSIDWSTPPDTGSSYEPYVRFALMYLAASLDVSYEDFTGDYRGSSDRTWRAAQVSLRRLADQERARIEHQVLRPLYRYLVDLAIATGLWTPPPGTPRHQLYECTWTWPAAKNPNEFQEFSAWREAIQAGLASRSQAIRALGSDPLRVDMENAEDRKRALAGGNHYTTHPESAAASQPGPLEARIETLALQAMERLLAQREASGQGDGDPDADLPEPAA